MSTETKTNETRSLNKIFKFYNTVINRPYGKTKEITSIGRREVIYELKEYTG